MPLRRKPSFRKRKRTPTAARRRLHNRRRKLVKRGRLARPRGLKPAVHFFTKKTVEHLTIGNDGVIPTGWTPESSSGGNVAITKRFIYNFESVPNYAQFQAMFTRYKLCGVKVTICPSVGAATGLQTASEDPGQASAPIAWMGKSVPLVAYVNTSRFGQINPESWTEEQWLGTQNHLRIPLKQKGNSFYMKLNMLQDMDATLSGGSTDYAMCKPKFISMAEPTARHYGYSIRLQAVDQTILSKAMPSFTVLTKFYFQCAGLQV